MLKTTTSKKILALFLSLFLSNIWAVGNCFTLSDFKFEPKTTTAESYDIQSYMQYAQSTIKQNWNPPKRVENSQIVVVFRINKNGGITAPRIKKSSGIKGIDNLAIEAIMKSAPLKPLPKDFPKDYVIAEFTFN